MSFTITQNEIEFIIRIFLAAICGCLIGVERKIRLKEAGMRTHLVVAFGAALFMIVSKYGFEDMINLAVETNNELVKFDPTRIASTIVTGIGFLGAGTIIVNSRRITGLTTAAGLWASACIGLAIGIGFYEGAIIGTVLVFFTEKSFMTLPVM
jgi:putative Mg2+ transporter-C (MgtC) family protein